VKKGRVVIDEEKLLGQWKRRILMNKKGCEEGWSPNHDKKKTFKGRKRSLGQGKKKREARENEESDRRNVIT